MANPLAFTKQSYGWISSNPLVPQHRSRKQRKESLTYSFSRSRISHLNKCMNKGITRKQPGSATCSCSDIINNFIASTSSTSDSLFSNITNIFSNVRSEDFFSQMIAQFPAGMFHNLATVLVSQTPTTLLRNPVVPIATVLVSLTGSAISTIPFRDNSDTESTSISLEKLRTIKKELTNLSNKLPQSLPENGLENGEDALPLHYDQNAIEVYFRKRPALVMSRAWFIFVQCSMFLVNVLIDSYSGNSKKNEQLRASQLVDLISKLGPTSVKIGQALSIRPDILPAAYIEALQKLQDRVPPFPNEEAKKTIIEGLGMDIEDIFSEFSDEPIAAASLGQVYKAKLLYSGESVAVKVQRPEVLETVSLDLYILRSMALASKKLFNQDHSEFLSIIDDCATHLYQEFDYIQEARNAIEFSKKMRSLPNIIVPMAHIEYTSQKVLTSSWIEGKKLSESAGCDIPELVSVALNCYLTQLLESGFLHADPHPGNLLQTPDGSLCVLDFGMMIQVTKDQQYALVDCISHLVNSDYDKVCNDLVNLGFMTPDAVDEKMAAEITPQLSRVLIQLVRGGGLGKIDFDQVLSDLTDLTKQYPIKIPSYFMIICRAFSILEGIGLKSNPDYVIIEECYPYLCKRLLTDDSPRARITLKQFLYGDKERLDAQRVEAVFWGFQKFRKVMSAAYQNPNSPSVVPIADPSKEILSAVLAPEGSFVQELLLTELVRIVDALSREALYELWNRFIGFGKPLTLPMQPLIWFFGVNPRYTLTTEDQESVDLVRRLWRLVSSQIGSHTVAELMATHDIANFVPEVALGAMTASTRFWLMLLHRQMLRMADDLDGRDPLEHWNQDPAALPRHVMPLLLLPTTVSKVLLNS